jgi:glycosyltransferase involved in cell wall biosynthesis
MSDRSSLRVHAIIDSLNWGGAEMLLGDLAGVAPSVGIELTVGYLGVQNGNVAAQRLRRNGIEPQAIQVRRLVDPVSVCAVRRHLAAVRPQIVHTHLEYADTLGALAARSLRLPAISTLHVMHWDGDLRSRARARLAGLVRRRCAYRVVAVSEAASRAYLHQGWDTPGHVVAIPNGSSALPEPGGGRAVRRELGIPYDALVVGTLTVLRHGKGHDVATEAIRTLSSELPDLRLLIAGDGPSRAEIERMVAPLGRAAIMAGHRDDTMAVLDACDVLVHPSRFDALPTGLIEAMAAGVPVVSTRVGGIPELVIAGETGLLVDAPATPAKVADALRVLLTNPGLRAAMGERARERYQASFTAKHWAARLRALYEQAIASTCAA